jgi:hypothetical protein
MRQSCTGPSAGEDNSAMMVGSTLPVSARRCSNRCGAMTSMLTAGGGFFV